MSWTQTLIPVLHQLRDFLLTQIIMIGTSPDGVVWRGRDDPDTEMMSCRLVFA